MDTKRLKQLAGLNENMSSSVQTIAEEIYNLAESRTANSAADQQGYGFDRNAIMREVDRIFIEVKAHIDFKLRNNKF